MILTVERRASRTSSRHAQNQWKSLSAPLGFNGGDTNLNRYVGNSPTNFVDPTGLYLTVSEDQRQSMELFFGKDNVAFAREGDAYRVVLNDRALDHLKQYDGDENYKQFLAHVAQSEEGFGLESANQAYADALSQQRNQGPYRYKLDDGGELRYVPNRDGGYVRFDKNGQMVIPSPETKALLGEAHRAFRLWLTAVSIIASPEVLGIEAPAYPGCAFSRHVVERMSERGVTVKQLLEAIEKGRRIQGNSVGTTVYQLPATQASWGRGIIVVVNNVTGKVITVIDKGSKYK